MQKADMVNMCVKIHMNICIQKVVSYLHCHLPFFHLIIYPGENINYQVTTVFVLLFLQQYSTEYKFIQFSMSKHLSISIISL